MRKKLFLTRGTLGLALAASVFLGCQDFLGDKGGQAPPSDADAQLAAQALASQDSVKDMPAQAPASQEVAQDLPAKPAETEPAKPTPPPATTALTPLQEECKALWHAIQTEKGDKYMEVKYKYIGNNCDVVLGDAKPVAPPSPPMTLEERCRLYRINLTETHPVEDTKWPLYLAEMAKMCADVPAAETAVAETAVAETVVTEPVKPSPPPAAAALSPEQQQCLDLYYGIQSGKIPLGKEQYYEGNCDAVLGAAKPAPPPYTPPTLEERCRMYRINLTQTQPTGDPKWQAHMDAMAIECAAYP